MIRIREEQPQDKESVHEVNVSAFRQNVEADLVDKLRENCRDILSLVAVKQNEVVGHILFTPTVIEGQERRVQGMGLAPLAVLPEYQRHGIGSELVRTGTAILKNRHCPFIIVIGHPKFYPRFGFEPANRYAIHSEFKVPDEVFMILVLNESEMQGVSGLAKYRPEFAETV
jgi:putative acetyltransferase